MFNRFPNLTRTIALILAFTMPFCCCIVGAISGDGDACCMTVNVKPCCNAQPVDWLEEYLADVAPEQEEPSDSCKGMSCCIKGFTLSDNWTPPCDTIGEVIHFNFVYINMFTQLSERDSLQTRPPPKICISQLGFSDAPSIRSAVILQV